MKCKNPNCDGVLGWKDGKCKKCGTWRNYTSPNDQSTPKAPTEKPLMAMSDSELLRKIAKHSEESAFVLKRFLFVAQVFAALWFIGMIIQFIQAAN